MNLKTVAGRLANKYLASRGVKLVYSQMHGAAWDLEWDLDHYPEPGRPVVPRYLNIGAAAWSHPRWHNLDHASDWYRKKGASTIHLEHDLTSRKPFALEDGSLALVFTSHTIEHLRDEDVAHMFSEVHRCLEPGGYFRITCPDVDLYYAAYLRGDADWWTWPMPRRASGAQHLIRTFATALTENPDQLSGGAPHSPEYVHPNQLTRTFSDAEINQVFADLPKEAAFDYFSKMVPPEVQAENPGFHSTWFNVEKATRMLHEAGFTDVWESRYLQSRCLLLTNPRYFDGAGPHKSLYVECRKGHIDGS